MNKEAKITVSLLALLFMGFIIYQLKIGMVNVEMMEKTVVEFILMESL